VNLRSGVLVLLGLSMAWPRDPGDREAADADFCAGDCGGGNQLPAQHNGRVGMRVLSQWQLVRVQAARAHLQASTRALALIESGQRKTSSIRRRRVAAEWRSVCRPVRTGSLGQRSGWLCGLLLHYRVAAKPGAARD
jgi:hypothetical protein